MQGREKRLRGPGGGGGAGTYLLRAPVGLQAGLQSAQQGGPVPRQPFEEPVAVGALNKLLLPLNGHLIRNPV